MTDLPITTATYRRLRAAAREALAMTLLQWALRIDGRALVDVITRGVRSAR